MLRHTLHVTVVHLVGVLPRVELLQGNHHPGGGQGIPAIGPQQGVVGGNCKVVLAKRPSDLGALGLLPENASEILVRVGPGLSRDQEARSASSASKTRRSRTAPKPTSIQRSGWTGKGSMVTVSKGPGQ